MYSSFPIGYGQEWLLQAKGIFLSGSDFEDTDCDNATSSLDNSDF